MYKIKRLLDLSEFKDCIVITPRKVLENYKKTIETLGEEFCEFTDVELYYNLSEDCEYMVYEIIFNPYFKLSEEQEKVIMSVDIDATGTFAAPIHTVSSCLESIIINGELVWFKPDEIEFYLDTTVFYIKNIVHNKVIYQEIYHEYYQIEQLVERLKKLGVTEGVMM